MGHKESVPLMHDQTSKQTLIQAVSQFAQNDGNFTTAIPALTLYRRSSTTEPIPCVYELSLAITVQGGKRIVHGEHIFDYGACQSLLTTVDMPVVAHVSHATRQEPFLGLRLSLDTQLILQLVAELDLPPMPQDASLRAVSMAPVDGLLLDAVTRLVQSLQEPILLPKIAPLIQEEITARLLMSSYGPTLRHLVTADSSGQRIAKALAWLKQNFTQSINMDSLAERSHMSPSTFRSHFRTIAGMSPLQYQKQLRLQEARMLMLNESVDAGHAAVRVGYESASQFSREYSRLFGAPPQRDIQRMKEDPSTMLNLPFAPKQGYDLAFS